MLAASVTVAAGIAAPKVPTPPVPPLRSILQGAGRRVRRRSDADNRGHHRGRLRDGTAGAAERAGHHRRDDRRGGGARTRLAKRQQRARIAETNSDFEHIAPIDRERSQPQGLFLFQPCRLLDEKPLQPCPAPLLQRAEAHGGQYAAMQVQQAIHMGLGQRVAPERVGTVVHACEHDHPDGQRQAVPLAVVVARPP